jgi:hypothetical protein
MYYGPHEYLPQISPSLEILVFIFMGFILYLAYYWIKGEMSILYSQVTLIFFNYVFICIQGHPSYLCEPKSSTTMTNSTDVKGILEE